MEWLTFEDKVHDHFDKPCHEVELMYHIGEAGSMSSLENEGKWNGAMHQLRAKIQAAHKCLMSMEIRNVVSDVHKTTKAYTHVDYLQHKPAHANGPKARGPVKGKGKEKRHRDDDIPPELDPETKEELRCLVELQEHLEREEHSEPGMRVFCWVDPLGSRRWHSKLSHEDITLWAKHMVSTTRSRKDERLINV
jgi:hypothetical protein